MLGTWFFQVRGRGCVEVVYEELRAWEQWRLRGSSHELCSSTQHTEEVQGGILAPYGYKRETVKDTLVNLWQQLSRQLNYVAFMVNVLGQRLYKYYMNGLF